jgi:GH25 family lysozyme M1 (1,4-beta-N-acetylmuramidase)
MKAVGIDVSQAQGKIVWEALEVDFVYRRVVDGALLDQEWAFQAHPGFVQRRYLVGGYAAFYPWVDALAQANAFADHHDDYGPLELPPAVDCENARREGPIVYREALSRYIGRIEERLNRRCIIYTRKDWWEKYATPWPRTWPGPLFHRDLWLARAQAYISRDACPSGWLTYAIWQKIFTAWLPGVPKAVDLDEFDGTFEDMALWAQRLRGA